MAENKPNYTIRQEFENPTLSDLERAGVVTFNDKFNQMTGEISSRELMSIDSNVVIKGTLTIDQNVSEIGENVFNKQKEMTELTFKTEENAAELKVIGAGAFMESGIQKLDIPKNVEHIGHGFVSNCEDLNKGAIYYQGSTNEFNKLIDDSNKKNLDMDGKETQRVEDGIKGDVNIYANSQISIEKRNEYKNVLEELFKKEIAQEEPQQYNVTRSVEVAKVEGAVDREAKEAENTKSKSEEMAF
jgi:hypothetical protein